VVDILIKFKVQKCTLRNCAYIVHQKIIRDGKLCSTQEGRERSVDLVVLSVNGKAAISKL
jgi:hypothetical protein